MAKKPKATSWTDCKKVLANWPSKGLVALVQELYRLSDENRRYLHGRLVPAGHSQLLAQTKTKVQRLLTPNEVLSGRFSATQVYRVLDQFAKAVDDGVAVTELTITALAAALETFNEIGDLEPIVDHIYVLLNRVDELLPHLPAEAQIAMVDLLTDQARRRFGYGISDELGGLAAEWQEKLDRS
jgi:hypothetical protein